MHRIPKEAQVQFTVNDNAITLGVGSQPYNSMGQSSDHEKNQPKKKCPWC